MNHPERQSPYSEYTNHQSVYRRRRATTLALGVAAAAAAAGTIGLIHGNVANANKSIDTCVKEDRVVTHDQKNLDGLGAEVAKDLGFTDPTDVQKVKDTIYLNGGPNGNAIQEPMTKKVGTKVEVYICNDNGVPVSVKH